jgi:hypothetical protein
VLDRAGAGDGGVPAIAPRARRGLRLSLRLSGTRGGNAEHVAIIGATQVGKSTIAHALVRDSRNLIVIDVGDKHQYDHLGHVTSDPDDILRHPVVIWTPNLQAVQRWSKDMSDPFSRGLWHIRTVRRRSGVTLLHDEGSVSCPTNPHPWVAEQLFLGAGQGVGVIVLNQGYSGVYPRAVSGATHWFLLRVADASQRGSLATSIGADGLAPHLARLPNHQFYYHRTGELDAVGPFPTSVLGPRPPR